MGEGTAEDFKEGFRDAVVALFRDPLSTAQPQPISGATEERHAEGSTLSGRSVVEARM